MEMMNRKEDKAGKKAMALHEGEHIKEEDEQIKIVTINQRGR